MWDDRPNNDGTYGVFGVDANNQLTRWPPDSVLQFFAEPIGNMYALVQAIFQEFPDALVTSWYRPASVQLGLTKSQSGAATHSQHSWGTAFDLVSPGGMSDWIIMAEIANAWDSRIWSSPPGPAYEGHGHFHMQQFIGNGPDWVAWFSAANNAGAIV